MKRLAARSEVDWGIMIKALWPKEYPEPLDKPVRDALGGDRGHILETYQREIPSDFDTEHQYLKNMGVWE